MSGNTHDDAPGCFFQAFTGLPAHEVAFNGSLCRDAKHGPMWRQRAGWQASLELSREERLGIDVATPAVVPRERSTSSSSSSSSTGPTPATSQTANGFDALFLASNGLVSAYDTRGSGNLLWQARTRARWPRFGFRGLPSVTAMPLLSSNLGTVSSVNGGSAGSVVRGGKVEEWSPHAALAVAGAAVSLSTLDGEQTER